MPDLSVFCRYTEDFAVSADVFVEDDEQANAVRLMEKEFVLQQLVQITAYYDLADEVGRRSLVEMIRKLLLCRDIGQNCMAVLVEAFARLYPATSRIHQLAEIISDLREASSDAPVAAEKTVTPEPEAAATATPVKQVPEVPQLSEAEIRAHKLKVAKVKVQLNEVREDLENCVRSLDLDKAQELKLKMKELQDELDALQQQRLETPAQTPNVITPRQPQPEEGNASRTSCASEEPEEPPAQLDDAATMSRCLTIICEMLRSADIKTLSPTLHSLHDNLLLPCLKNQDALVRELSVKALALLCSISKDLAYKHLPLFIQISQVDVEAIQICALKALFDILLLHGLDNFTAQSDETSAPLEDVDGLTSVLSKRLEEEEAGEVRTAIISGLCKLLIASRLQSPKLLSQLILMWYNPLTEEDNQLRQMLGSFFPVYASKGGSHQEILGASLLPTVRTITDAPPRSLYSRVDIDDVCSFLLSITSPAIVSKTSAQQVFCLL